MAAPIIDDLAPNTPQSTPSASTPSNSPESKTKSPDNRSNRKPTKSPPSKKRDQVRGRGGKRGAGPGPRVVRPEDLEDGDERLTTDKPIAQPEDAVTDSEEEAEATVPAAEVKGKEKVEEKGKEKAEEKAEEKGEEKGEDTASPAENDSGPSNKPPKETRSKAPNPNRGKPRTGGYVNPERVNTGGLKNEKLGKDELDQLMQKMRLQNETLKQKRELAEADEARFKEDVAAETAKARDERLRRVAAEREARVAREARAKQSQASRQVQENINATREEAAKRKMAKKSGREWDAEKGDEWANSRGGRGGSRGGGRGSGRGGGRNYPQQDNPSVAPVDPEGPKPDEFPPLATEPQS